MNNLVPEAITDRNGKRTTVYKKTVGAAPSSKKLQSAKPVLAAQPSSKKTKVTFTNEDSGSRRVIVSGDYGIFARAGLARRADELMDTLGGRGSVEMSNELLYKYLRVGVTIPEAGLLHLLNDERDNLSDDLETIGVLPGDLSRDIYGKSREISGVVDFLAEGGIKPQEIQKVLFNNLTDEVLEKNVLTAPQLVAVFSRFTNSGSSKANTSTKSSHFIEALVDGTLPHGLADKSRKIDRATASNIFQELKPQTNRRVPVFTEQQRQEILNDPEMLVNVVEALSSHHISRPELFFEYKEAIEEFGVDACAKYRPNFLRATMPDGSAMGVEGADEAAEVIDSLRGALNSRGEPGSQSVIMTPFEGYSSLSTIIPGGSQDEITVTAPDLVIMRRSGASIEQITDLILGGLNSSRALAVYNGEVSSNVASGWL